MKNQYKGTEMIFNAYCTLTDVYYIIHTFFISPIVEEILLTDVNHVTRHVNCIRSISKD